MAATIPARGLAPFQVQYGNLVLGPGTPYQATAMLGFEDMAGMRQQFTSRARTHGAFVEPHYLDGAIYDLTVDITAQGGTSFAQAILNLQAATTPLPGPTQLTWQMPGHPQLTVFAQVLRRSIPVKTGFEFGLAESSSLQWFAPDPLKYGVTKTATARLASGGGGMTYPITYPITYGTQSNGQASVTNYGSAPAYPVLTVSGPFDSNGFVVNVIETGQSVSWPTTLNQTDTLVINCATGSVVLNGQSDRRAQVSTPTGWPVVAASTTATFALSTAGAYSSLASCGISWSDTYY